MSGTINTGQTLKSGPHRLAARPAGEVILRLTGWLDIKRRVTCLP